ncbi:hypothetical protein [Streptomyces subrutilus]|uniref:hypothetical protein n=1 Tax=Streptomyces subrutilus TaxID=36818 RepID=UPI002E158583|nr:hypothetical protein OG479_04540 [Streptomyces subrutilus]
MLRAARTSVPATQQALAELLAVDLAVDLTTVQGWESGRRPLANMKAGLPLGIRRHLAALGSSPAVLALLDPAMDADRIIAAVKSRPRAAAASFPASRTSGSSLSWVCFLTFAIPAR